MFDAKLLTRAAAGDPNAFVALIKETGPAVRLFIAAYSHKVAVISHLEQQAWRLLRAQLPSRNESLPIEIWMAQIISTPLRQNLQAIDRQAIASADVLLHQVVQDCLTALEEQKENGVFKLQKHLNDLDTPSRDLLNLRYRNHRSLTELAIGNTGGQAVVASALMQARTQCDWRGIASVAVKGEMMLPALIEDWLSDNIDHNSRALLANSMAKDLNRTTQVLRQLRVHVVLSAFYTPFSQKDAENLAHATLESLGQSVVIGSTPKSSSSSRLKIKSGKPSGRISGQPARGADTQSRGVSYLPYIISAVLIGGGVIALISLSFNKSAPSITNATPPAINANTTNTVGNAAQSETPTPKPALEPPLSPAHNSSVEIQVSFKHPSNGSVLDPNQKITLAVTVSHYELIDRVEYMLGKTIIGTVNKEPWSLEWNTNSGNQQLVARVVSKNGAMYTSDPIAITVNATASKVTKTGSITREWWKNIPGSKIADAANLLDWPLKPHGQDVLSSFSTPQRWGDDYIQHIRGYIIPPMDGNYYFTISSDDEGQLWLSTDESPLQVKLIAPKGSGRGRLQSEGIFLQANQRYYIEARHKEGGGNDFLNVSWKLPNGDLENSISGQYLAPLTGNEPAAAIPRPTSP